MALEQLETLAAIFANDELPHLITLLGQAMPHALWVIDLHALTPTVTGLRKCFLKLSAAASRAFRRPVMGVNDVVGCVALRTVVFIQRHVAYPLSETR